MKLRKKTNYWKQIRISKKRCKKELKKRKKKRERKRFQKPNPSKKRGSIKKTIFKMEGMFSIRNNPDETICFLNDIKNSCSNNKAVYVDISNVQEITVDALLYLLALIDNIRFRKTHFYIQGNLPKALKAKELFIESGFLKYVNNHNIKTISANVDCMQIYDGRKAEPEIAKNLCLFAMKKLGKSRENLRSLYNIIMEIIINTKQHAYDDNETKLPKWYVYARYNNNGVDFSILDTGSGIPATIKKDWIEKLNELIARFPLIKESDSKLIKSVMNGDFRTQTGDKFRGKGIPSVVDQGNKQYIKNLTVVSNSGFIALDKEEKDLKSRLEGTLYYWRIEK